MESFDSLLTCCICLDRYRNPKLLPCQHSFCMEPCMEGLIDYVKRQIKCPECRAEHRIPYKGIQDFPNNVTLQRFLDMYHVISGELPDPTQGQLMERCTICNEKDYLHWCAHCDKRICDECRSSHVELLKREVARINSQVRRGVHRLHDALQALLKNSATVRQNCLTVREEVDHIGQRLIKAIRDRTEFLKAEVESHMDTEVRSIDTLRSNLEQEIGNIESNAELVEKHMLEDSDWDDCELMDAKEIFLRTVEFIRNFEHDQPNGSDYRRPIRFSVIQDPNSLSKTLEQFGELNINKKELVDSHNGLLSTSTPGFGGPGLMRSKSDHRLVAQMRHQEERGYGGFCEDSGGRSSPQVRRRFGERPPRREAEDEYESPCERRHKYRSRYSRRHLDVDDDGDAYRSDSYAPSQENINKDKKEREKVLETDDCSRGPLSGISRIADVPRVMQKLADAGKAVKKQPEESVKPADKCAKTTPPQSVAPWRRQKSSEEDEIYKIKKQNKDSESRGAVASDDVTSSPVRAASVSRVSIERSASQSSTTQPKARREESGSETEDSSQRRHGRVSRPSTDATISETVQEPQESRPLEPSVTRKTSEHAVPVGLKMAVSVSRSSSNGSVGRRGGGTNLSSRWERNISRSNSSDSTSSESSASNSKPHTGAVFTTSELKSRFQQPAETTTRAKTISLRSNGTKNPSGLLDSNTNGTKESNNSVSSTTSSRPRFQSRFLGRASTPKANISKESESSDDSSSSSESDSSDSDSDSDEGLVTAREVVRTRLPEPMAKTSIGPLLARSAQARNSASSDSTTPTGTSNSNGSAAPRPNAMSAYATRRESAEFSSSSALPERYGTGRYETEPKPYESRFTSRYGDYGLSGGLMRSRTSSHLESRSSAADNPYSSYSSKYSRASRPSLDDYTPSASRYSSYSSRFLNRSKSSAALEESEETAGTPAVSADPASGADAGRASGKSRYVSQDRPWLARSRSSEGAEETVAAVKEPPSPPSQADTSTSPSSSSSSSADAAAVAAAASKAEALSSWAQYLKNKYSHRNNADKDKGKQIPPKDQQKGDSPSSKDLMEELDSELDQAFNILSYLPHSSPARTLYKQKGRLRFQLGSRGGGPGCFTWPRGIAVGPDNSIVVADSSNHRVQVFDVSGKFVKEFGQYGNGEAEFDCLAGVSVNSIGQYIISDRYNHRIQLFDPSGRFLASFGQNGTGDGRFNYPWGVTTDALGFIYVCDKENHRVQVFQSDGTFVGAFGSEGHSTGQLAHPHYIAVSSTNRVVVTDSNNHRVQVFDINGKCLTTFGGEGSEHGRFKFPRGVAVDDDGFIIVCDSGNNRIQIFNPDGTFLNAFGSWGSQDGQFKGLEGVAVMSDGTVLVCDRENHRVQVF